MKYPQCAHKTEKEADKGNGRCSRCAMPCMPLNAIRFWSPFLDSVRFKFVKMTPKNAEIIDAFLGTPKSTVPHTAVA